MKSSKVYLFLVGLVVVGVFARAIDGHPAPQEEGEEEDEEDYDDESARFFASLALTGIKQGIKQGIRVVGSRIISSTAAKLITTGAVKFAKSQVVRTGKKVMIKLGTEVAQQAVVAGAQIGIETAIEALKSTPEEERQVDLFEYMDVADICQCNTNVLCSCCVALGDNPDNACFHVQLGTDLWAKKGKVSILANYGSETFLEDSFGINKQYDKCVRIEYGENENKTKFKFCVITMKPALEDGAKVKCFDLRFNDQLLRKCIQQKEDGTLSMKYYKV